MGGAADAAGKEDELSELASIGAARQVVEAALGVKALDVVALDVRELTSFADVFVVATGTSDRHVKAVADAVVEAGRALGAKPLGVEGYDDAHWVLIDLNDVVVHVFRAEARQHYDLERLWSDAPPIPLADEAVEQAAP